jgi:hypothetical protein
MPYVCVCVCVCRPPYLQWFVWLPQSLTVALHAPHPLHRALCH